MVELLASGWGAALALALALIPLALYIYSVQSLPTPGPHGPWHVLGDMVQMGKCKNVTEFFFKRCVVLLPESN